MIFLHDVLQCCACCISSMNRGRRIRASCSGLSVGARTRGRGRALAGPRGLGSPWLYLVVRLVSFRVVLVSLHRCRQVNHRKRSPRASFSSYKHFGSKSVRCVATVTTRSRVPRGSLVAPSLRSGRRQLGTPRHSTTRSYLGSASNLYLVTPFEGTTGFQ